MGGLNTSFYVPSSLPPTRPSSASTVAPYAFAGITDENFQTAIRKGIVKVNIATASFNRLMERTEEYMQTEGAHNYFSLNEAMVRGTYLDEWMFYPMCEEKVSWPFIETLQ